MGGTATQSAQFQTASADKAIDGNYNTNWKHGSCSTTMNSIGPWWRLDLLKTYKINTVSVTIRDDSFIKHMTGAEIRIGNSLNDNGNVNPRYHFLQISNRTRVKSLNWNSLLFMFYS